MRWVVVGCALSVAACGAQPPASVSSAVFTPAHRTAGEAASHFFNRRPEARQPIAFPHKVHLAKKAVCTDCHETVERGPVAGSFPTGSDPASSIKSGDLSS